MNPLLQLILSLSLGGSLMALLVLGLKWTLRGKLPSAFFYCAWLAVLLRLVLPLPGFMSLDSREEAAPAAVTTSSQSGIPYVGARCPPPWASGRRKPGIPPSTLRRILPERKRHLPSRCRKPKPLSGRACIPCSLLPLAW